MKKFLLFSLLITGSTAHSALKWSKPICNFLRDIVKPFENADALAEKYYKKNLRGFCKHCTHIPENYFDSKDKLAKYIVLHNEFLLREKIALAIRIDGGGEGVKMPEDPNEAWNNLSTFKRCWLTFKHRSPYTFCATLSKWGIEIALVAACAKALGELKKKYQERTKPKKVT